MIVNIISERTQEKSQEVHSTEPELVGRCIRNITVHINVEAICVYLRKRLFSISPTTPPPPPIIPTSRLLSYRAISNPAVILTPPPVYSVLESRQHTRHTKQYTLPYAAHQHHTLGTTHYTPQIPHYTLHATHYTVHTGHYRTSRRKNFCYCYDMGAFGPC